MIEITFLQERIAGIQQNTPISDLSNDELVNLCAVYLELHLKACHSFTAKELKAVRKQIEDLKNEVYARSK